MTQTKNKSRRVLAAVVGAGALLLSAGAAQAALQDRDLDSNGQVDAFYDTDLNITWLRDANVNGAKAWNVAVSWADGLSFGGYDDWRLPVSDTCFGVSCVGSEMGHLWYVELGNSAGGPMTNTGNFQNLQSSAYWSGTEDVSNPIFAWYFNTALGNQAKNGKLTNSYFALAVRDGDVPAIPEPQTYALLLAGLSALAVVARRRTR